MSEETSGTNTLLLVIILVIVVAGGVWLFNGGFGSGAAPEADNDSANIEVNIPTPDMGNGEAQDGGGDAQPQ